MMATQGESQYVAMTQPLRSRGQGGVYQVQIMMTTNVDLCNALLMQQCLTQGRNNKKNEYVPDASAKR